MNKIFLLPLLLCVCLCGTSCREKTVTGSGPSISENRQVQKFTAIDISSMVNATIIIDSSASPSIKVAGYENLVKLLKTEVKDNTLKIYMPDDINTNSDQDLTVLITVSTISALSLSGSVDADIQGNLRANDFDLDISGACDAKLHNIVTSNLSAGISGTGKVIINGGTAQKATFSVSGAGSIKAYPLQSSEAIVEVSGVGDIELTASQKLKVEISGAGNVHYKGHPEVSSETSGAGALVNSN
ncbi:MAG: head GIN domain-containing protein [Bacteroidota bacterium]